MLQSTKLKGAGDLKTALTSDIEMQSLEFAQLVFGLALVQYFLTMLPSLHFRMVMDTLCHFWLDVCDLTFNFILQIRVKRLRDSQKRL